MAKIRTTAKRGDNIIVDTSKEACAKFDVEPGEEISPLGCGGINVFVVGTGPSVGGDRVPDGTEVLWVSKTRGEKKGLTFFPSRERFQKI